MPPNLGCQFVYRKSQRSMGAISLIDVHIYIYYSVEESENSEVERPNGKKTQRYFCTFPFMLVDFCYPAAC